MKMKNESLRTTLLKNLLENNTDWNAEAKDIILSWEEFTRGDLQGALEALTSNIWRESQGGWEKWMQSPKKNDDAFVRGELVARMKASDSLLIIADDYASGDMIEEELEKVIEIAIENIKEESSNWSID